MNSRGTDKVTLDVHYEVYLRYRDDPILVLATFELDRSIFTSADEPFDVFIRMAQGHVLGNIDTHEHRLVFEDGKSNTGIGLTDEIQWISILAPEKETFERALEE